MVPLDEIVFFKVVAAVKISAIVTEPVAGTTEAVFKFLKSTILDNPHLNNTEPDAPALTAA